MSGDDLRILIAEDDDDDQLLMRRAAEKGGCPCELAFVTDGEQLIERLHEAVGGSTPGRRPCPDIVVVDLNMPRVDGFEALRTIKNDPRLCSLPVVVLTTSVRPDDMVGAYRNGASSYLTKPIDLSALTRLMEELCHYWKDVVRLPPKESRP